MDKSGVSKMGKWKQVQRYAKHIPSPLENYKRNQDKASGILMLDATFTKVKGRDKAIMIAYDTGIGVVDYWIDETENKTAYNYIFRRLEGVGYKIICVISDGHFSPLPVIKERKLPHQRCVFHLIKELFVRHRYSELKGRDKVLYSRLKGLLKTKRIDELPQRIDFFRFKTEPIFHDKRSILDWFWKTLPNGLMHLSYEEKIPNGTHLLENLNG